MRTPVIRISDSAKKAFQDARVDADVSGDALRLAISARFEGDLFFDPRAASDIAPARGSVNPSPLGDGS